MIEHLPDGYQTMLGRWFHGGHELSVGQWQKLPGQSLHERCRDMVLDEPTASLDAETEYEIFRRFQELTVGKMAILISHRFSTVRMADRIVVIQEGRIAEIGSHHDLLNQGREVSMATCSACKRKGTAESCKFLPARAGHLQPDFVKRL